MIEPVVEVVIDAELVSPRLGLTAETFVSELKRGVVYQVTERSTGGELWPYRITFRYRARRCQVLVAEDGRCRLADDG